MSIKVKPNHPVAEEIARILSGIGGCPSLQQSKMVNEAAKRAAARVDEANARAEKAKAELAHLIQVYGQNPHTMMMALEQSVSLLVSNDFELIAGCPSDYPELAEWLRNREK